MTAVSGPLLAGAEIRVDGRALDPAVQAQVLEVRVDQHLRLPDRASLRLADPRLELADSATFALGAAFEVLLGAPDGGVAGEPLRRPDRRARAGVHRERGDPRRPRVRPLAGPAPHEAHRHLPGDELRRHRAGRRAAQRADGRDDRVGQHRPVRPAEQRDRLGAAVAPGRRERVRGLRHRARAALPARVGVDRRRLAGQARLGREPVRLPAPRDRDAPGRVRLGPLLGPDPQAGGRRDRRAGCGRNLDRHRPRRRRERARRWDARRSPTSRSARRRRPTRWRRGSRRASPTGSWRPRARPSAIRACAPEGASRSAASARASAARTRSPRPRTSSARAAATRPASRSRPAPPGRSATRRGRPSGASGGTRSSWAWSPTTRIPTPSAGCACPTPRSAPTTRAGGPASPARPPAGGAAC